ncbi:MAG: CotH kinase family protein, partial [Acidobacteria bacterium]|nr:CotH kinase family protein [Acidobacteriota bacterium]
MEINASGKCGRYVLFVALLTALAAGTQAQTPILLTSDDLFNDRVLHEIRLYAHPTDWATLRARFQENIFFPADMTWRFGNTQIPIEQVGIRSRGLGSRNGIKPGLLINFARYNDDVRFLGLRSLVLRNNVQDTSQMHEHLGMTFFRRMGLPASRTAMTRLFVNDEYMGVYTIVESIDEEFLQRHFNQQNGYLYSYDYGIGTLPYFFEYKGPDPAVYSPHPFEPENHRNDPDPGPIVEMIRTMNEASDADFFNAMAQYLDLRL